MAPQQSMSSAALAEQRIMASSRPEAQALVEQTRVLFQIRNILATFLVLAIVGGIGGLLAVLIPLMDK